LRFDACRAFGPDGGREVRIVHPTNGPRGINVKQIFSFQPIAIACVLFAGIVTAARAADTVIDPTQTVAGFSQLELSQQWWQWAIATPGPTNPLFDATGANAGNNNNGPVFFLAGNAGGLSARTFDVPVGKPVFFPIINAFDAEVPDDSDCDIQCAFRYLDSYDIAGSVHLHATLDGKDLLLQYPSFRQRSTSFFPLDVPVDDPFGFPSPYEGRLDAVTDGHWVALDGLSPGKHTLVFGGTSGSGFTVEVVDFMTAVPEAGTSALMLAGLLVVGAVARCSTVRKVDVSRRPDSLKGSWA
jgi:hypothetical protein